MNKHAGIVDDKQHLPSGGAKDKLLRDGELTPCNKTIEGTSWKFDNTCFAVQMLDLPPTRDSSGKQRFVGIPPSWGGGVVPSYDVEIRGSFSGFINTKRAFSMQVDLLFLLSEVHSGKLT